MRVRIIPAYIGWRGISEDLRGAELYYQSLLGKNRNIDSRLSYSRIRQSILSRKLVKAIIKLSPKSRCFKFRDYLNSQKDRLWILDRIIKELIERLDYVFCYDELKEADINYYINWHAFKNKSDAIDIAWFTHFENKQKDYFIGVAKQIDYAICHSTKYKDVLQEAGVFNSSVISPGIDTDLFTPKLILGYAGGTYSERKGRQLLSQLRNLEWVELRLTEGRLAYNQLPNFYRQLDYVFVPSVVEGGPMCLVEGLACGIPVIAPRDVGAVEEYTEGTIHYEKGNFASLKLVLEKLFEKKLSLRKQVKTQTWENFVHRHDELFRALVSARTNNKEIRGVQ